VGVPVLQLFVMGALALVLLAGYVDAVRKERRGGVDDDGRADG